ncbi:hypothetical protein TCAL_05007, partial [Tigriopus californicus]
AYSEAFYGHNGPPPINDANSNQQWVRLLRLALAPANQRTVGARFPDLRSPTVTYQGMANYLHEHLSNIKSEYLVLNTFLSSSQKPGEPFSSFFERVADLASRSGLPCQECRKQLIRHQAIRGTNSQVVRFSPLRNKWSVTELLTRAHEVELSSTASGMMLERDETVLAAGVQAEPVVGLTRFPVAVPVPPTASRHTIGALKAMFLKHGNPTVIRTDNATTFSSQAFEEFVKGSKIKHMFSPPHHPNSNPAECTMRLVGKAIKLSDQTRAVVNQALQQALQDYRDTPHPTTGAAPGTLMAGRDKSLSNKLGQIRSREWAWRKRQTNAKKPGPRVNLDLGQQVLIKNQARSSKFHPLFLPTPFKIIRKLREHTSCQWKGATVLTFEMSSVKGRISNLKGQITEKMNFIQANNKPDANEDRLWQQYSDVEDLAAKLANMYEDYILEATTEGEAKTFLREKEKAVTEVDSKIYVCGNLLMARPPRTSPSPSMSGTPSGPYIPTFRPISDMKPTPCLSSESSPPEMRVVWRNMSSLGGSGCLV